MKILLYGINYSPDLVGVGKYSGEMVGWLSKQGHEFKVITAPPYYPEWTVQPPYSSLFYHHEIMNGVRIWRCPIWVPKRPTGLKRIFHLASFAITSFPIIIAQIFWRPEIVLAIEPPLFCAPTSLLVSRLCRARSWLHIQDYEIDAAFELGILKSSWSRYIAMAIERWLLGKFDRVSSISARMVSKLSEKGVAEERQILFPNWVDIENIRPADIKSPFRKELEIDDKKVVALYSGNMSEKQGLDTILASARLLADEQHILFVLCGEGPARERLKGLADGLENVVWLPLQPIERVNDLLNLADIHLLPQRANAADLVMPSKLTGMLASGRPVVAGAAPDTEVAEVVHGKGLVVTPDDATAFADAILDLAGDAEKRQEFGKTARIYAEERLNKEGILNRFEQDLLACLGATNRAH